MHSSPQLLRILRARSLRRNMLQNRVNVDSSTPLKVAIIYTGGTIGCVGEPLSPLDQTDFQKAFEKYVTPIIQQQYPGCELSFLPFGDTLDSTNLQPSDWCKMARFVLEYYAAHDIFLILHGTDTMAWTASALSFLLTGLAANGTCTAALSKPVVVTGSQLPLFFEAADDSASNSGEVTGLLFNTDALQNVCGAIEGATYGSPEVCLFFDYQLFRGNRTVKTDASEFRAFSSPNYPTLGEAGIEFTLHNDRVLPLPAAPDQSLEDEGVRARLQDQLKHIASAIDSAVVVPFVAFPAPYNSASEPNTSVIANMLTGIIDQGLSGLCLESYGAGNFPSGNPDDPAKGAIYKVLNDAHESGIVILDATQVLSGVVNATVYAAGSWLAQVGATGVYDMTPIAASAKLIYLLSLRNYNDNDWTQADIERHMQINIAGEMMDVDRLDSRGERYLAPAESLTTLDGTYELVNSPSEGPLFQTVPTEPGEEPIVAWRALTDPPPKSMPGRLYMQNDGKLVFYDSSNDPLYSSRDSTVRGAYMLIANGESQSGGPSLSIFNYATNELSATLFP